jgi:conjugative transfer signal peptidase TraF
VSAQANFARALTGARLLLSRLITGLTVLALILIADAFSPVGISINHSKSLPRGIYWNTPIPTAFQRGQLVCFPYVAPQWAKSSNYFLRGTLLCKAVLGLPGDKIVMDGRNVSVCEDTRCYAAGRVLSEDTLHRAVPLPQYPAIIPQGELFLSATRVPNSFDSRYLGLIAETEIVREIHPLLTE